MVEKSIALVYLVVQSSTRAFYFPKRPPMVRTLPGLWLGCFSRGVRAGRYGSATAFGAPLSEKGLLHT